MFSNDSSSKSKPDKHKSLHTMYCRSIVVVLMGQCVLVLGGRPFLSALHSRENRGKRAHTCECSAKGGPRVCIVFNRWESRGWERVCACLCVLGACWSVFFLRLSTSEHPLHLAGSRTSAKMTEHTPLFHSLSVFIYYVSVFIYYINLSACLFFYRPYFIYLSVSVIFLSTSLPFLSDKLHLTSFFFFTY